MVNSTAMASDWNALIADLRDAGCFAADQHGASWNPERWEAVLGPLEGLPTSLIESRHISREDLHGLGQSFRREPSPAFVVAVMAWGYGDIGYGPWRTRQALQTPGALDRIYEAIDTTCLHGAVAGYRSLAAAGRPKFLGATFGTKLICFGAYRAIDSGPKPVILDYRIGKALERHGYHFACERWQAADSRGLGGYGSYVDIVQELAGELRCSAEDVEYRLWVCGG